MSGDKLCRMQTRAIYDVVLHRCFPAYGFELLITRDTAHSDDLHICMQSFDCHCDIVKEVPDPPQTKADVDALFEEIVSGAKSLAYKLACQSVVEAKMSGSYVVH